MGHDFDLIIVGGGGGGITAAMLAHGLGKKVALIDKKRFGGECTWSGCVPSKSILHAAKMMWNTRHPEHYGLSIHGEISVSGDHVMSSVQQTIREIYEGEKPEAFEKLGITAIENASIHFIDSHTIEVNGKTMRAGKFLIATGSSPLVPKVPGLSSVPYYTNETIFTLETLPASLTIMGGGPIGIELAQAMNRLGVAVTVIEMAPSILIREEAELSAMLAGILKREGVTLLTGAKVLSVENPEKPTVVYEKDGKSEKTSAAALLIAAGRKPNTEGLGLETIGLNHDRRGIAVDNYMRTSIKTIYAAGDVVGPYQFSHVANYQAIAATSNALLPIRRSVNYGAVPWCTFTDPELARSGLTEAEAREKFGSKIRIYRAEYSKLDRARTDRATEGLAMFVCHANGKILGVHILGERAGEVMHEAHAARTLGIPLYRLDKVIHTYPTYSELTRQAARAAYIDRISSNPFVRFIKLFRSKNETGS
jgi:pyruvate/2-oxoglutarate dehydrogenase complex dihydrolipoamide dehydrogenase (E3) component